MPTDPTGRYRGSHYDPSYRGRGRGRGSGHRGGHGSISGSDHGNSRNPSNSGRGGGLVRGRGSLRRDGYGNQGDRSSEGRRQGDSAHRGDVSPFAAKAEILSSPVGSVHPSRLAQIPGALHTSPSFRSKEGRPETPSLVSRTSSTLPAHDSPLSANALDSLAKLKQFKLEVEASRASKASSEPDTARLAQMAQTFLLTQQHADLGKSPSQSLGKAVSESEPGEVLEDDDRKTRELELKEKLLKRHKHEEVGQAISLKRDRGDDEHHYNAKRARAEDRHREAEEADGHRYRIREEARLPMHAGTGHQQHDRDHQETLARPMSGTIQSSDKSYQPSEKNFVSERYLTGTKADARRAEVKRSQLEASERYERRNQERRSSGSGKFNEAHRASPRERKNTRSRSRSPLKQQQLLPHPRSYKRSVSPRKYEVPIEKASRRGNDPRESDKSIRASEMARSYSTGYGRDVGRGQALAHRGHRESASQRGSYERSAEREYPREAPIASSHHDLQYDVHPDGRRGSPLTEPYPRYAPSAPAGPPVASAIVTPEQASTIIASLESQIHLLKTLLPGVAPTQPPVPNLLPLETYRAPTPSTANRNFSVQPPSGPRDPYSRPSPTKEYADPRRVLYDDNRGRAPPSGPSGYRSGQVEHFGYREGLDRRQSISRPQETHHLQQTQAGGYGPRLNGHAATTNGNERNGSGYAHGRDDNRYGRTYGHQGPALGAADAGDRRPGGVEYGRY